MAYDPSEDTRIVETSLFYGVDPLFMITIRRVENGGANREFGVLSVATNGYDGQLAAACVSVRNRMAGFEGNPHVVRSRSSGIGRLSLTDTFIELFGNRWAPEDAENDPSGLNANWVRNAQSIYKALVEGTAPGERV